MFLGVLNQNFFMLSKYSVVIWITCSVNEANIGTIKMQLTNRGLLSLIVNGTERVTMAHEGFQWWIPIFYSKCFITRMLTDREVKFSNFWDSSGVCWFVYLAEIIISFVTLGNNAKCFFICIKSSRELRYCVWNVASCFFIHDGISNKFVVILFAEKLPLCATIFVLFVG